MALVLCTGLDKTVLETRRLILENAGHTVVTVTDETALVTVCQKQSFEVAVVGQTLSPNMKLHVVTLIKENCPNVKILELYSSHAGRMLDDADSSLAVPADAPSDLAERVGELARKYKRDDAKP
jgi:ActR/RegA family two-component response regulator